MSILRGVIRFYDIMRRILLILVILQERQQEGEGSEAKDSTCENPPLQHLHRHAGIFARRPNCAASVKGAAVRRFFYGND